MSVLEFLALIGVGLAVGTYASAIGAGGGFLLAPFLLIRHPDASPAEVAMASLSVVAVSSGLAAILAARAGRLDAPVAAMLLLAAIPAALFGALGTSELPRDVFAAFFAALLLVIGTYLAVRPELGAGATGVDGWRRFFRDGDGTQWAYRLPVKRSIFATSLTALLAAFAGIGGGLIYTPLTTRVMRMPFRLAVPVSHVVITGIAVVVVVFHAAAGHAGDPLDDVPALAIGVIIAGPIGRRLHNRLGEGALIRILAAGLFVVGVRTAIEVF